MLCSSHLQAAQLLLRELDLGLGEERAGAPLLRAAAAVHRVLALRVRVPGQQWSGGLHVSDTLGMEKLREKMTWHCTYGLETGLGDTDTLSEL